MGHDEKYSHVTNCILAECVFAYLGERAFRVRSISWPAERTHVRDERPHPVHSSDILPAVTKFYLIGKKRQFSYRELFGKLAEARQTQPDIVYWQFQRHAARAVCQRASENWLWGFGRPHPTKPQFKTSQWHAGPLVDYAPGSAGKESWVFEPVFIRTIPDSASLPERIFKIYPVWNVVEEYVELRADENPPDIPVLLRDFDMRISKGQRDFRQRVERENKVDEFLSRLATR